MDIYQQIGPDRPNYADDVNAVRMMLDAGDTVVFAFAANATSLGVVLVKLDAAAVLKPPAGFGNQNPLFVGVVGYKSGWLPVTDYLDPGYVGQYLGHPWGWHNHSDPNDEPFAAFLNDVLGHTVPVTA